VCRLIASRPKIGRERPDLKPNIRSFGLMSWIIFYRIDDDFVEIVRVLQHATWTQSNSDCSLPEDAVLPA
jgi:plasmid stabilization system protein ParE